LKTSVKTAHPAAQIPVTADGLCYGDWASKPITSYAVFRCKAVLMEKLP
jgi:hypothetical protein